MLSGDCLLRTKLTWLDWALLSLGAKGPVPSAKSATLRNLIGKSLNIGIEKLLLASISEVL